MRGERAPWVGNRGQVTGTTVGGTVDRREYRRDDLSLSMVRPGESVTDGLAGLDPVFNDLPDGECPREDGVETSEWNAAMQGERYLDFCPSCGAT